MKRLAFFFVVLFVVCSEAYSDDITEHPGLIDAIKKYYATVEKAKLSYENELRRVLSNTQKAGNVKAYNAIEAELDHTIGKDGHSLTDFMPPQRSTLYSKKASLKRAVDAARKEFNGYAEKLAAELLKDGLIDAARDVDLLASAVEPPRFYIEKHDKDISVPVLKIDLPLADTLPSDWLEKLPQAKIVKQFEGRVCYRPAWSPDGKEIATIGNDHRAILWDMETGKELAVLERENNPAEDVVCFTPDGKSLLFVGDGGEYGLWNPKTKAVAWKRKDSDRVTNLAVSSDGRTVFACTEKGVFLSDVSTGRLQRTLTGHTGATNNALLLPNDSGLITTGDDAVTIIWNMKTWKSIQRVQAHEESIRCLCASPDGRYFATGSNDDTVVIWDARTGKPIRKLGLFGGDIIGLEYSPDGSKLGVSRHWQGSGVFVFDTKTWKPTLYAHAPMWNTYFAWSPDGRRIVACGGSIPNIFEIP